jgi:superfamily II DNA helicase RecQ
VRFVLHWTAPKNLLAYYQESGRSGRDGKPADCVCYFSPKDLNELLPFIYNDEADFHKVFPDHEFDWEPFWNMVGYCLKNGSDGICRRLVLESLEDPDVNIVQVENPFVDIFRAKEMVVKIYSIMDQNDSHGKHTLIQLAEL